MASLPDCGPVQNVRHRERFPPRCLTHQNRLADDLAVDHRLDRVRGAFQREAVRNARLQLALADEFEKPLDVGAANLGVGAVASLILGLGVGLGGIAFGASDPVAAGLLTAIVALPLAVWSVLVARALWIQLRAARRAALRACIGEFKREDWVGVIPDMRPGQPIYEAMKIGSPLAHHERVRSS